MTSPTWKYGAMAVWRYGSCEYVNHERIDKSTGKIGAFLTIQYPGKPGWEPLATVPCLFNCFEELSLCMWDIARRHAMEAIP